MANMKRYQLWWRRRGQPRAPLQFLGYKRATSASSALKTARGALSPNSRFVVVRAIETRR